MVLLSFWVYWRINILGPLELSMFMIYFWLMKHWRAGVWLHIIFPPLSPSLVIAESFIDKGGPTQRGLHSWRVWAIKILVLLPKYNYLTVTDSQTQWRKNWYCRWSFLWWVCLWGNLESQQWPEQIALGMSREWLKCNTLRAMVTMGFFFWLSCLWVA